MSLPSSREGLFSFEGRIVSALASLRCGCSLHGSFRVLISSTVRTFKYLSMKKISKRVGLEMMDGLFPFFGGFR